MKYAPENPFFSCSILMLCDNQLLYVSAEQMLRGYHR